MDQSSANDENSTRSRSGGDVFSRESASLRPAASSQVPHSCISCGSAANASATSPAWVYAVGKIRTVFPSLSVEKEFAQATARGDSAGLTDRQSLHKILSEPQNGYLVRQLRWVMRIQDLDTYILYPRDAMDLSLLVEALRPVPQPADIDVVIGVRGPIAGPEVCNGLLVPIVAFDQIYSFDREALIKGIPRPEKTAAKEFTTAAAELFDRIMQMADNAGATDEHRVLNYLTMRYPAIYTNTAEAFARNASLSAVEVRPSPLSGTRRIEEVIFSYINRNTDVTEKFSVRVDATEEFPFLVKKWSSYFDR